MEVCSFNCEKLNDTKSIHLHYFLIYPHHPITLIPKYFKQKPHSNIINPMNFPPSSSFPNSFWVITSLFGYFDRNYRKK